MRIVSFFLLGFLATASVRAQTEIYEFEDVSGTWTKANSPYIVMGEAIVPNGETLIIEPGVVVRFVTGDNREYNEEDFALGFLRVYGTLKAEGTEKEPILFTRDGDEGLWGCIHINSFNKKSTLKWCVIEYAHYIREVVDEGTGDYDNSTGAISFYGSGGRVENCVIRNSWAAINAKNGSQPIVSHCTIVDNEYALESNASGFHGATKIKADNCILHFNQNGFFISEEGGVSLAYSYVDKDQWDDNIDDKGNNIPEGEGPQFIDLAKKDYRLKKKSPCRKKGKDGTNMGAF
jgi:hypothetical protein